MAITADSDQLVGSELVATMSRAEEGKTLQRRWWLCFA